MRTHLQMIEAAGGTEALATTLGLDADRVRFWTLRKSIPPEEWPAVVKAGIATLDELAGARHAKRDAKSSPRQGRAA